MADKISASMMCGNLLYLKKDVEKLKKAGVEYLHWDIMDGVFVPNFSMFPDIMKEVDKITNIKFDTHLMITNPDKYIDTFIEAGTDMLVVHAETTNHLHRVIQKIKGKGIKAGVALNPATPLHKIEYILNNIDMVLIMTVNPGFAGQSMIPSTLKKIEKVKKSINKKNLNLDIQVDGNVSFENAVKMKKRGANVFVAGTSSIFGSEIDIEKGVKRMRSELNKA